MPELVLPQQESRAKALIRRLVVFVRRRPRCRLAEVQSRPIVNVADVSTSQVLKAARLDSTRFLITAHLHPNLLRLLQKLETEVPLRTSEPSLQVFRDRKVWEIAFREAVETGAEFLQLTHLLFGVLALEEMREVLSQLSLKIEDVHETLKWMSKSPGEFGVSKLEQLKSRARGLEGEHSVLITYPVLLKVMEKQPDDPIKLLVEVVSAALRSGRTLISSEGFAI